LSTAAGIDSRAPRNVPMQGQFNAKMIILVNDVIFFNKQTYELTQTRDAK